MSPGKTWSPVLLFLVVKMADWVLYKIYKKEANINVADQNQNTRNQDEPSPSRRRLSVNQEHNVHVGSSQTLPSTSITSIHSNTMQPMPMFCSSIVTQTTFQDPSRDLGKQVQPSIGSSTCEYYDNKSRPSVTQGFQFSSGASSSSSMVHGVASQGGCSESRCSTGCFHDMSCSRINGSNGHHATNGFFTIIKGSDRGDGVASIKRRRRDLSSDGVMNLTKASGRNRLNADLEDSTWRRCRDHNLTPDVDHTLPNKIDINNPEPNGEHINTPLISPFLDSDDESDDGEVIDKLNEYGNAGNFYPKRVINSLDGEDLALPYMIGFRQFVAYFDPFLPMNIITRKAYNTIMLEGLESTRKNLVAIVKNIYVFVESFTYVTDFVVLEDIGEFIISDMTDVVMGRPFRAVTQLEYDCVNGLILFNRIFETYIFRMPRTIHRLKNFNWSMIPPKLKLSQRDLMRWLRHPHEKNKLVYKNCLNLGPEYQVDESMKE
ncbi:hypothetical protein Tco_0615873 [Tanacetum coccineum]